MTERKIRPGKDLVKDWKDRRDKQKASSNECGTHKEQSNGEREKKKKMHKKGEKT